MATEQAHQAHRESDLSNAFQAQTDPDQPLPVITGEIAPPARAEAVSELGPEPANDDPQAGLPTLPSPPALDTVPPFVVFFPAQDLKAVEAASTAVGRHGLVWFDVDPNGVQLVALGDEVGFACES